MNKYRIWDKRYNQYTEEPFYRILLANNGKIYNQEEDKWYNPKERYIIEFSTGMTDKEENEIYHNDILAVGHLDFTCPVTFSDGCFQLRATESQGLSPLVADRAKRLRIIGNINQHKNLLNESN